ncbi:MAG: SpoIIIAH-like family protein [Oscillospiraceae bacterium]|jgi:stage III sporulation protein AH|nr:SpoIIIAH-like family protein [Oscillospiraceae bacterium]
MRNFKRNAVVVTVILFVAAAAYLNWWYGKKDDASESEVSGPGYSDEHSDNNGALAAAPTPSADIDDSGLFYSGGDDPVTGKQTTSQAAYFAETRLNRASARDAAIETLSAVTASAGASPELTDSALSKIAAIADFTQKEAEIEALIMAKGFTDCVVYISDEGIKVTVPAPEAGLSTVEVAKITDIVTSETAWKAKDLTIIEVK